MRRSFIEENDLKYQEGCLGMQDFKFFIDSSKVGTMISIDYLIHLKRGHEEEETVKRRKSHPTERAALYAQFQRESIKKSRFQLEEEYMQGINDIITEIPRKNYSKEDILRLYFAFKEIIRQEREINIDYLPELEYSCKKILGDRILTRADIFD